MGQGENYGSNTARKENKFPLRTPNTAALRKKIKNVI